MSWASLFPLVSGPVPGTGRHSAVELEFLSLGLGSEVVPCQCPTQPAVLLALPLPGCRALGKLGKLWGLSLPFKKTSK